MISVFAKLSNDYALNKQHKITSVVACNLCWRFSMELDFIEQLIDFQKTPEEVKVLMTCIALYQIAHGSCCRWSLLIHQLNIIRFMHTFWIHRLITSQYICHHVLSLLLMISRYGVQNAIHA